MSKADAAHSVQSAHPFNEKCECVRKFVCRRHRFEQLCEHFGYSIGLPNAHDEKMLRWLADFDQETCEWVQSLVERSRGGRP